MDEKKLRKKLLRWHYDKSRTIHIVNLLQSTYQCFRYRVQNRLGETKLDFREAIKKANKSELWELQNIIDEERLGI